LKNNMKIGILSDTHNKFQLAKDAIDLLVKEGVTHLIHAGDICQYDTLEYIKNTKIPYTAIYGNNDRHLIQYHDDFHLHKEPHYFNLEDIKFKLMHLPYYLNPDSDIVIFGHTHKLEVSYKEKTLYINPGEVCAREDQFSTFILLEITTKDFFIKVFFKDTLTDTIKEMKYEFKR